LTDRTAATSDPADRAMANFVRASETWALASGGSFWASEGLACAATPVPRRAFNQVLNTSAAVSDGAIRDAIAWFGERDLRFRVRMRDVLEGAMGPRLEALGLESRGGIPAMVLDSEMPAGFTNSLDIRPVTNPGGVADMVAVVAEAFHWEAPELAAVFQPPIAYDPVWHGWVGYEAGVPVASSQIVVHEGVAGLYYVATLGSHRRKGYGEAITRIAIDAGRAMGCDLTTLNASPDGYPVYKRLNFRDTGRHIGYVIPDEDAQA